MMFGKRFSKLSSVFLGAAVLLVGSLRANAQGVEPLPQDTALLTGKLPNGLTYYIRHNETPKERADFYIAQKVGSMQEEDNQSGLAHFLEHMAFNGTKNFPEKSLINYLETIGVRFGANLNAYTAFDQTVYTIMDAPTTRQGIVDSCLLILHDWSHDLTLEGSEIDKERGVIHEEWRQRESGSLRNFTAMLQKVLKGNKYADRMPIGKMSVVDNFKHEELRAYYRKWYRPDLQAIIVVGDIDPGYVLKKLQEMFKDVPAVKNPAERVYYPVEINKEAIAAVTLDPEATRTEISISFKTERMPDELKATQLGLAYDYMKSLVLSMMNTRLKDISKKPNPPFLAAGASLGPFLDIVRTLDAFEVSAVVKEEKILDGYKTLIQELERLKQFGFTPGEYKRAKDKVMALLKKQYNERKNRKNGTWAEEYVDVFLEGGDLAAIETRYQIVEQYAQMIPLEAINQVAQQLVTPEGISIVLSGQKKDGVSYPTEAELLKKWDEWSKLKVEPYKDAVSDEKLIASTPKAVKISKETVGMYDSKIWTLPNGARVIFKPTDFKEDEVRLSATRKVGYLNVPKKDVIYAQGVTGMPAVCGLGKFDATALEKVLSGRVAKLQASLHASQADLDGQSTKADLETLLQLLYLHFTAPRYDKEAYKTNLDIRINQLEMAKANPMSSLMDSIPQLLSPNDPYQKSLRVDEVKAVSQNYDKVYSLYKEYFDGVEGFDFVFVGNIDEAKLKDLVQTYIATLPKGKTYAKYAKKQPALKGITPGVRRMHYQREFTNPTAFVFEAFSTKLPYTLESNLSLVMLGRIMDQYYTASLREDEGGTYGAGVESSLDDNPKGAAALVINFQTSPDRALKLDGIARRELKLVAEKGPDMEKFQKTKENLLKDHKEQLRENNYWMRKLEQYYQDKEDWVSSWEETLQKITPEHIKAVAAKLLEAGNDAQLILYSKGQSLK